MMKIFKGIWPFVESLGTLALGAWLIEIGIGSTGAFPNALANHVLIKTTVYFVLVAHVTIVSMSLCFHRMHTHKGVVLHPIVDYSMQFWLWISTSMSKRDWVSVHAYHHATSDTDLDPHSPVVNGFWHSFLLGAFDYAKARKSPEVLKIRAKIPTNQFERFIENNTLVGPIFLAVLFLVAFGPLMGLVYMWLTFLVSPIFAIGGVNTLAHYIGYRNYKTEDNSRNIGFLLPLNWIIAGELDHNNHHAHPNSASFSHRWFEFDVGYFYLKILSAFKLAKVRSVRKYERSKEKSRQWIDEKMDEMRAVRVKSLGVILLGFLSTGAKFL
ncbi:MAG: fatty acid desaturase [Xanthomonadaceae bacterium]|nr:fatty acid desaturase [Xanthomonadaceae bacterium]